MQSACRSVCKACPVGRPLCQHTAKGEEFMRTHVVAALAALALIGAPSQPAAAHGCIDPVRPVPDFGVVKLRTTVGVRVTGRVARVEVEEHFQHRGPALGEGDYLYPLPGEAVFSNFSLYQGDQELRGETM